MATFRAKITHTFGGLKWGWQEVWYWTLEDGTIEDAISDGNLLALARRDFLGTNYALEAVHAEEVDRFGNSFLTGRSEIAYNVTRAGPGKLAGSCQNPWLAAYIRWRSDTGHYHRNQLLRGIPDNHLCIDAAYKIPHMFPATLTTAFSAYFAYVKVLPAKGNSMVGTCSIRAASVPTGKAIAKNITSITVNPSGFWLIEVSAAVKIVQADGTLADAAVGDVIHVSAPRKPWAKGLSDDHRISAVAGSPPVYTLGTKQARDCEISYAGGSKAWGVNYELFSLAEGTEAVPNPTLARIVNKGTGKPHFGTRGRRSARVCP